VSRYLIDTSWLVDVLNGQQEEARVLEELATEGLAISLITYGELFEGAYYARNQTQAQTALSDLLTGMTILPLTSATMERFAILRGSLTRPVRQQVGDMDLLIAATALEHNLILVTNNRRDFTLIPGLTLYPTT
jgi:tRNA(fMet)-specific endonuclease VapC